jgi:hypothetical protein
MKIKAIAPIFALLLAVGIIFGTFMQFSTNTPFGFGWFVNMLWFAIGFPVLLIIGYLVFSLAAKGQEAIEAEKD